MYPITQEVQEIFANNRQTVDITFDSVAGDLHLTEENILSGGLSLNRYSVSGDMIEIGSVVAGEIQLTINNSDGSFNDVTFEGATMFVRIGSKDWETEGAEMQYIPLGYFTVDEAPRKLDSISFSALDGMVRFDKTVNMSLMSFPMTVQALLNHICSQCGVTLAQSITGLPNYNYSITTAPTGENLTYRQLLSWIAQITGTCAFIDWNGQLVLKWYADTSVSIPASMRYDSDLKENAVTISGVRVVTEDTEYISGTDTYAITIEGNELIQHHYSNVASAIALSISGFSYTPFEANVKSMPFLYPMDKVTFVKDQSSINTIITNMTYVLNGSTKLEGRGETSSKKGYATMNPLTPSQTVVINNGLATVSATLTQEFTAADGVVISKIANAENKYDESSFTAGTITLKGFSGPVASGLDPREHNGEYFLNQTNGYVYLSDGSSWSRVATLTLMTTVLSSSITQTDTQIRSDVAATYSTKNETTTKADAARDAAIADTDTKLQSYSTTTQMNSAIDQKANSIILASSQLTYGQRTKNLIPFVLSSASKSSSAGGTTCTRTSSGTGYRLTNNPTSNITFSLYTTDGSNAFDNPKLPSDMMLPVGRYIVSGIGFTTDIQYRIQYSTDGSTGTQLAYFNGGNEITFDVPSTAKYVRHYIWVRSGTDLGSGVTVRPMIRDATITDSTYSAGIDAGAYMCSSINLTPEKLELDAGKLIINAGNFQLDSNGTVTITSGIIKTSNYAAASGSTKTVGGQINLSATGSTLLFDTANFKITGAGAVTAEDATFTNCTISGGTFTVNTSAGSAASVINLTNTSSDYNTYNKTDIYAGDVSLTFINYNDPSPSNRYVCNLQGTQISLEVHNSNSGNYELDIGASYISYTNSNLSSKAALTVNTDHLAIGDATVPLKLYGSTIWANNPIQTSSDARKKNSIEKLDNRYLNLIRSLVPRRFKYNDNPKDRYHSGFIAQELHENMKNAGLSYDELAALVDDGSELAIRYGEMIPLLLLYIRYLEDKLNKHLNERGA